MKKKVLFSIAVLYVALVGCNNAISNQGITPNYKFKPIGDQAFFEVSGPVQKIIGSISNCDCIHPFDTCEFNKNGICINLNDAVIKRKDAIIKLDMEPAFVAEYEYNRDGYISKSFSQLDGGRYTSSYKYNNDNLLIEEHTQGGYCDFSEGDKWVEENVTIAYEYIVIDNYGNWLERNAITSETGEKRTEKRIITYFSDPIEIQKYKIL